MECKCKLDGNGFLIEICDKCKAAPVSNPSLIDWLNATELVNAYAYRVYHADTDAMTYELTVDKDKALKMDAYPIELKPTLLMR